MDKQKKTDKLIKDFTDNIFKLTPEMMGINICGVAEKKRNDTIGDLRVSGYYIENKNFRDKETKKWITIQK